MTQILGLAEAAVYVSDLARARQFYEEVLGLPVTLAFADSVFVQTGPQATLILFDLAALQARTSPIPAHGAAGQGHVALAVAGAELDAWRERLRANGIAIEHEQDWPAGTHSIYFRDPDGNSLELIEDSHYPRMWQRVRAGH